MAVNYDSPDTVLNEQWTPEQESALLKALVHYKPVGLHGHFRMISVHNYLLNSGTTDADTVHTKIPAIWAKLKTLYDLDELNDREDEVFTSLDEDDELDGEASNHEDEGVSRRGKRARKDTAAATAQTSTTPRKTSYWRDFDLNAGQDDSGFEALMWQRRLNPEGSPDGSDWDTTSQTRTRHGAAAGDTTDEPRSSPVGRGTRSGRKGRVNRLKDEMEVDTPTSTRSSRRASKAASEDEDHTMEDAEDEDDEDGDDDEEEDSEDENDGDEEKKGGAAKRGRGGGRGRGKRGRRRK